MKQLLVLLLILSFAFVPFVSTQQDEVVIFVGYPEVKIVAAAKDLPGMFSKISTEKTFEFRCEIVKRGDKYYWKSRDNYEVVRELTGAFVEFRRLDRPDYVRIANSTIRGESLAALALKSEAILSHDYVEHLEPV